MTIRGVVARLIRPTSLAGSGGFQVIEGTTGDLKITRDGDEVTMSLTRGEDVVDAWRMDVPTFLMAIGMDQQRCAEAFARSTWRHRR